MGKIRKGSASAVSVLVILCLICGVCVSVISIVNNIHLCLLVGWPRCKYFLVLHSIVEELFECCFRISETFFVFAWNNFCKKNNFKTTTDKAFVSMTCILYFKLWLLLFYQFCRSEVSFVDLVSLGNPLPENHR